MIGKEEKKEKNRDDSFIQEEGKETKKERTKKEIEELREKLEKCEKEKQEFLRGWQRERADFINYKNSELERLKKAQDSAKRDIFLELLKVIDNLERAREHLDEELKENRFLRGILQIEAQLRLILEKEGVREIKAEGEKFNPYFHEATQEVEVKGKESGEVVEVVEKGYLMGEKVLRPAKVKISK